MLIGELSQKTGLSKDTIRYYEKIGLLGSTQKRNENNYRQYNTETVSHLLFIKQGKMMGFTLNEIKTILDDWQNNRISHDDKVKAVQTKIEQVEEQINQLQDFKRYLVAKLKRLEEGQEIVYPNHC
ncbi:MerR family transcriptional regulator [Scytonema sp. NUACC26]|uniref:MerR family transcriptional regulator n=1 Tax=Scytonema sp. NUACC26 TaxID=3140176 RepID=UPI0034DCA5DE